jgi:hypothetical protein
MARRFQISDRSFVKGDRFLLGADLEIRPFVLQVLSGDG